MPDLTAGRLLSGRLQRGVLVASLFMACTATASVPAFANAKTTVSDAKAITSVAKGAPTAADQATAASGPTKAVAAFETELLSIMKAGKSVPFVQQFDMLAPVVDRTFDLETILHNSVGLKWSGMSEKQRATLLATFRRYTIATWVANFNKWSGQQFKVSSDVRHVGNQVVVPTDLVPKDGSPVNLSYVMRQEGNAWKVVDVLAQGSISRVAVQRSDFRSLLANGGVSALVASLQRKISSLSDGSLA